MLSRETVVPVFLAWLVVSSVLAGAVGSVAAQTSTYETTVGDAPEYVVVDLGNLTSEVTIEVETDGAPGHTGTTVLYRDTHNAANYDGTTAFGNAGAYENVTIRVKGASAEPKMGAGSDFGKLNWRHKEQFASTGGDRGFKFNHDERLLEAMNPAVNIIDRDPLPGATDVDTDASDTELEVYQSASTSKHAANNSHTMLSNRLQDTEEVALMKGKAAYIWEVDAGGSELAAETNASDAIQDYYSTIQMNYISEWNRHVSQVEYLDTIVKNKSGVSNKYVEVPEEDLDGTVSSDVTNYIAGTSSKQVTLENGTSVSVKTLTIENDLDGDGDGPVTVNVGISDGTVKDVSDAGNPDSYPEYVVDLRRVTVEPPTSDTSEIDMLWFQNYADRWDQIQSQTTTTTTQMDSVVSGTYDEMASSNITAEDIVDPFTLSNAFSPGTEYQSWATATLALAGVNQPQSMNNTGQMTVTLADGTDLTGLLMSQANPSSGSFTVGDTYDPSTIGGPQYIVADGKMYELGQNFTLDRATTATGENTSEVVIETKTYDSTTADDISALYDQIAELRTELEARQTNMNGGGGGGLLAGGQNTLVVLGLAGAGLYLLGRDAVDTGGRY